MRLCAFSCSQRWVATVSKSICFEGTTSVLSSRYGWSTDIAPSKKNPALLSSGDPAKSSMLNGPSGASAAGSPLSSRMPRPVSSEVPCCTPTV